MMGPFFCGICNKDLHLGTLGSSSVWRRHLKTLGHRKRMSMVAPGHFKEDKCFACDKKLNHRPLAFDLTYWARTNDDQFVHVGSKCITRILKAGKVGYQPPKGGPKLFSHFIKSITPEEKLTLDKHN